MFLGFVGALAALLGVSLLVFVFRLLACLVEAVDVRTRRWQPLLALLVVALFCLELYLLS